MSLCVVLHLVFYHFFSLFLFYVYGCVACMYVCITCMPVEARRATHPPGAGAADGCALHVLLAAEPCLAPLPYLETGSLTEPKAR